MKILKHSYRAHAKAPCSRGYLLIAHLNKEGGANVGASRSIIVAHFLRLFYYLEFSFYCFSLSDFGKTLSRILYANFFDGDRLSEILVSSS